MKKIYLFILFALSMGLNACENALNETPNKSGSAYIYHMDQLYGLNGNYTIYNAGSCWNSCSFRGDGLELSPYFAMRTSMTSYDLYKIWSWKNEYLESTDASGSTWTPCWNAIYIFNTVLENMDRVIQTTPAIRRQVEGEALFGRAYFHFIALVEIALWNENAPGIGYRFDTAPNANIKRETVKYTLDNIYKDLDNAEAALIDAGRTEFEAERNFRPTVPTVKALKARINLYRGNYTDALTNAEAALAKHNVLYDFKNDELYDTAEMDINVLDETNNNIVEVIKYRRMPKLKDKAGEALWKHPEFYLPHFGSTNNLPISESYYDLFDHENDERWKRFYGNNYIVYEYLLKTVQLEGESSPTTSCFTWEDQQGVPEANRHAYRRFLPSHDGLLRMIGMTTAEMYLIKAECLARAGKTAEAANILKELRRTRFTTIATADNIGGTLQEVLDERAREMTELFRFFDTKRLNGADNANIKIKRMVLTDLSKEESAQLIEVAPDDSRWAVPISSQQIILMGWEQN